MRYLTLLLLLSGHIFGVSVSYPLSELSRFTDALNIEGGRIPRHALGKSQLWLNLCFVLDRPFIDEMELHEITEGNSYQLKEASIESFNESQMHYLTLCVLDYYFRHAHEITGKSTPHLLLQVHRNRSGPAHLAVIEKMFTSFWKDFKCISECGEKDAGTWYSKEQNVELTLRYGSTLSDFENYSEMDLVFSLSLAAGFNQKWESGDPLLPTRFVPTTLERLELLESYEVENHIVTARPKIVAEQRDQILRWVNTNWKSENENKWGLMAHRVTERELPTGTLLQVDRNFNPSALPDFFHSSAAAPFTL
jgi:hypothetical protein